MLIFQSLLCTSWTIACIAHWWHTHLHTSTYTHPHTHIRIHAHSWIHTHEYKYTHTHIHTHTTRPVAITSLTFNGSICLCQHISKTEWSKQWLSLFFHVLSSSAWLNKAKVYNSRLLSETIDQKPKHIPLLTLSNHHSCFDDPGIWGEFSASFLFLSAFYYPFWAFLYNKLFFLYFFQAFYLCDKAVVGG